MENEKERINSIIDIVREFMDYLEANGYELNENGDVVPKNLNKHLSLELKNEE
jgi:hypothetical protein